MQKSTYYFFVGSILENYLFPEFYFYSGLLWAANNSLDIFSLYTPELLISLIESIKSLLEHPKSLEFEGLF